MTRLALAWMLSCTACATASTTTAEPTAAASAPGPITAATSAPASIAAATVVFAVRHAEKADDGTGDPPLTEAGQSRARCLAHMLGDAGVTHVYATELQRTQQTVAPLAAASGIEIVVVPAQDTADLVAHLDGLPPGSVAVVAGHSNTVPKLAEALQVPLSGLDDKGMIPHEQYDRFVEIVRGGSMPPKLLQLHYCD